jgi:hypothetical protein
LSIESYEGDVEPCEGDDEPGGGDDELCVGDGAGLVFRILVPSASPGANRRVSSPNDRWQAGQETAVSGISCLHEGQIIGGEL